MKKRQLPKVQLPKPVLNPIFERGRELCSPVASLAGEQVVLVSDQGGRLWRIDCAKGEGRPVTFSDR